jgi:hypothetical protein
MPATEDVAEMAGGITMAMEAMVEALWLLCLARHWSKGHAKTLKVNKGKDGDMLRTSKEKKATYI